MSNLSPVVIQSYKHALGWLKYCALCSNQLRLAIVDEYERREETRSNFEQYSQKVKNYTRLDEDEEILDLRMVPRSTLDMINRIKLDIKDEGDDGHHDE